MIDEASQIQLIDAVAASMAMRNAPPPTAAAAAAGSACSGRLIVAGDPLQFPPIVEDGLANVGAALAGAGARWCRAKCGDCLRGGTDFGDSTFSLVTASVFDALLWRERTQPADAVVAATRPPPQQQQRDAKSNDAASNFARFTDVAALAQQPRPVIAGMFQLQHSFRSTPEIVNVVSYLYPGFTCGGPGGGGLSRCRAGIVVTVLPAGAGPEAAHVTARVRELLADDAATTIAVVTPRRHQRTRIRDTIDAALGRSGNVSATPLADDDDDDEDEQIDGDGDGDGGPSVSPAAAVTAAAIVAPAIVVDTTERMQGDQADAVLLAFADVRNAKFALNLRRINVAISRARRYVELVVTRALLDAGEAEVDELDAADAKDAAATGRPRSYCRECIGLLRHFVACSQRGGGDVTASSAGAAVAM